LVVLASNFESATWGISKEYLDRYFEIPLFEKVKSHEIVSTINNQRIYLVIENNKESKTRSSPLSMDEFDKFCSRFNKKPHEQLIEKKKGIAWLSF